MFLIALLTSSVDKGVGFAVYNVCYHPKALTWTSPIIMKELDEECLVVHDIESPHGAVSQVWKLTNIDTRTSITCIAQYLATIVVRHQRIVSLRVRTINLMHHC